MNEYKKRLCDLVNLEENSRSCVVLIVKPETDPLDLIRLGGFDGSETMFRMTKNLHTTSISVFRDGQPPYHMNYGSSNTLVGEDRRKVRDLVMECVNLDFGIFTHDPTIMSNFDALVDETSGKRDLDSTRYFTLKHTSNYSSLFVNEQHIANIPAEHLDTWLTEHNACLEVSEIEHKGSVDVERGNIRRSFAFEQQQDIEFDIEPTSAQERYEKAIDEAGKAFLAEGGWQGKDAAGVVQAFAEFVKKRGKTADPSLDDTVSKTTEMGAVRNSNRKRKHHGPRPRWLDR